MIAVTFKVSGLKECEAGLDELKSAIAKGVIRRAMQKAANIVVDAARQKVERRSGVTAASLQVASTLTKGQRKHRRAAAVAVYAGVGGKRRGSSAHTLEFGSAHAAPQPFLRPAADENAGRVNSMFVGELKIELEKAKARARRKAARVLAAAKKG